MNKIKLTKLLDDIQDESLQQYYTLLDAFAFDETTSLLTLLGVSNETTSLLTLTRLLIPQSTYINTLMPSFQFLCKYE